jgi:Tol biopolymer transport system component
MKAIAVTLAMSAMLTVDQYDLHRQWLDGPSSAVSADGRYVAFITYARLTGADNDNAGDVYVLDRIRQQVTFESPDVAGPIDCFHPGISGDGRYVVFEADGSVVWRDRLENVTRIAARGRQPSIAENGHTVVFTSNHDVYSLDLRSGESRRVSIELTGLNGAPAASVNPRVSADGRYVSFSAKPPFDARRSPASQSASHVFVRDTVMNITRHVGKGWAPSMSGNGRYVAFVGPVNGLSHIFLADLQTDTTRVITQSVRRGRANGSSANPGVSSDGRFVVFQSQASDLVRDEDFNLLWDVFVYDRTTETIIRVSGDPDDMWMEPSIGPSIDGTGSVIAFSSRHPTGAADKRNDFDLYVAALYTPTVSAALSTEDQNVSR